jgi:hypothetical protein
MVVLVYFLAICMTFMPAMAMQIWAMDLQAQLIRILSKARGWD